MADFKLNRQRTMNDCINYGFRNGEEIAAIHFANDSTVTADAGNKLIIVFEPGQMSLVPWAAEIDADGNIIDKWNLSTAEGVRYPSVKMEGEQ
jgi:hypothetical protein